MLKDAFWFKNSDLLRKIVKWKSFDFALYRPNFDGTSHLWFLAIMQDAEIMLKYAYYFRISLVLSLSKIWGEQRFFKDKRATEI